MYIIKNVCIKELGESIADARRAGDADKSMEIIAETMKLIGNSLYGRCVMNKERHVSMNYADDNNITKRINDPHFKDLNKISENTYEVFSSKRKIKMDVPIQVGCAVYDLAKLRMLQFYYDCIDYYIDRSNFIYCQMDTDSAYIAFSGEFFEDLIDELYQLLINIYHLLFRIASTASKGRTEWWLLNQWLDQRGHRTTPGPVHKDLARSQRVTLWFQHQ